MIDSLKDKLKFSRIKAGLTQKKVAELLGVHPQTITKHELGENRPGLEMLDKIAKLYKIDLAWLLREGEFPQSELMKGSSEITSNTTNKKNSSDNDDQMARDLIKALQELNEARKDIAHLKEEIFELKKKNRRHRDR